MEVSGLAPPGGCERLIAAGRTIDLVYRRVLINDIVARRAECDALFTLTAELKAALRSGKPRPLLEGRTLAMIFEKPSLRTRVSFEVALTQLGATPVHLTGPEIVYACGGLPFYFVFGNNEDDFPALKRAAAEHGTTHRPESPYVELEADEAAAARVQYRRRRRPAH